MSETPSALCHCREEEYAFCLAGLWRCPGGWNAVPFPLRGPGSLGCLASLLGVWVFSRRPFRLVDHWDAFRGRKVVAVHVCLGSYGMGGPGFLGFRVHTSHGRRWMVYRLWSAAEWLLLDGRLVNDGLFPDERQRIAADAQVSVRTLIGCTVDAVTCDEQALCVEFRDPGGEVHVLRLGRSGEGVLPWRGTGGRKVIPDAESLDDVIVVTRSGRLWLD